MSSFRARTRGAVFVLGPLEPLDVGDHPLPVRFGIGGGENHGLKPDRVGAVELLRAVSAEKRQCLLDDRRVRLFAGGEQGERGQTGGPGGCVLCGIGPRSVGPLAVLEELDPLANGLLHFLAGDAGPRRRRRRPRTAASDKTTKPIRNSRLEERSIDCALKPIRPAVVTRRTPTWRTAWPTILPL